MKAPTIRGYATYRDATRAQDRYISDVLIAQHKRGEHDHDGRTERTATWCPLCQEHTT